MDKRPRVIWKGQEELTGEAVLGGSFGGRAAAGSQILSHVGAWGFLRTKGSLVGQKK